MVTPRNSAGSVMLVQFPAAKNARPPIAAMTRFVLTPLTAAPINPPKRACDPEDRLRPAANTAEFANFSGDRSPTCEFMNMVLLLLKDESWIANMYLFVTFSTKNLRYFFWRNACPACLFVFKHPFFRSLGSSNTSCDPGFHNPTIAKATSRGSSSQLHR